MRRRPAALATVALLLSACGVDGVGGVVDDDRIEQLRAEPDQYAAYLEHRETQRRVVPLLVRGLADALGGRVDRPDGDWRSCAQRGDETYAFSYGVTAVVRGAAVDPGLTSVTRVLRERGWRVTEEAHSYDGRQLLEAARDDMGVVVNEGDPGALVVRAGGPCFTVPEADRDELRERDRSEPLVVPPP